MYFNLPTQQEQQQQQKQQQEVYRQHIPADDQCSGKLPDYHPTVPTPNMSNIHDESWAAIVANLNDHKSSPPLVTPNTLSQLLNMRLDGQHPSSQSTHSSQKQTQESTSRLKYAELIQNVKQLGATLSDRGLGDELQTAIDADEDLNHYLSSTNNLDQSEDAALKRLSSIIADFTNILSKRPAPKLERNSDSRVLTTNITAVITTPPVNKMSDSTDSRLVGIQQEQVLSPSAESHAVYLTPAAHQVITVFKWMGHKISYVFDLSLHLQFNMPRSIHVEQLLGSGIRSPATPGASARFTVDRRKIIIGITLTAVIVSVIRLAAYIHYSAKLKDATPPVESFPDIPVQNPFPAYWALIYYLCTIITAFVGFKWYTGFLQQRLQQQREQVYLRVAPYSVMDTLSYRYLETSISIPFVTTSTSLRSVLVVLAIVTLNLICATWPHSPNQLEQSNRAAYLAVANFSLLIPLSIRSFPWMALDTAISWHRVFGMLAFVCAAQHGCYRFSERLESLKPIMESKNQVTGLFSILAMATMILASHELVRTNRYAVFRTVHLSAFLMLIISLSLHKRAFLLVNVFGIVWWVAGRVWRKRQSAVKLVRIQNVGKFTQVTLEYPFKNITAGQFAYLGITGAGFSKPGWARPFSFSGLHTQKSMHSPVAQEKNHVKANATTISSAYDHTETHHRPAFHQEASTTQVPDKNMLDLNDSMSSKDKNTDDNLYKTVDLHVHARGRFTNSLFKAASLQDPESHASSQIHLELDGPYGAPWLSLSKHYHSDFETVVLICSGAGITPWIAVMQALVASANENRTRHIHVIWSIHDIATYESFNPKLHSLLKQSLITFHINVYITGSQTTLPTTFNESIRFHSGRPKVTQLMMDLKRSYPDIDVGVGVCAYDDLTKLVDQLVHSGHFSDQQARWYIKKELFRI